MPTHVRAQVRAAVQVAVTGLGQTADRVYIGRTRSLPANHQPSLVVYTTAETSKRALHGRPPILERPVIVSIEGRVSTATPPDDLLDVIAGEVEVAIAGNAPLGALAFNLQFIGTETDVQAEGERHLGAIRLQYAVTYRTAEGQPYDSIQPEV